MICKKARQTSSPPIQTFSRKIQNEQVNFEIWGTSLRRRSNLELAHKNYACEHFVIFALNSAHREVLSPHAVPRRNELKTLMIRNFVEMNSVSNPNGRLPGVSK